MRAPKREMIDASRALEETWNILKVRVQNVDLVAGTNV